MAAIFPSRTRSRFFVKLACRTLLSAREGLYNLTRQLPASQGRLRQASAEIVVTPEMTAAGVETLNKYINLDDARPIYSEEEIVDFIFKAMAQHLDDGSSGAKS
jgi:hypothetical protein